MIKNSSYIEISFYSLAIKWGLIFSIDDIENAIKICKSRVWIYSHIGNKNTQRHFKTNIKELTQTQAIIFKALL